MGRAPFQVLVIPYWWWDDGELRYAFFKRNHDTGGYWQGIAGGGEDAETPLEAAKREALEEAGIPGDAAYLELASCTTIPVIHVSGFEWGPDVLVIPEHTFGVQAQPDTIRLSDEHTTHRWFPLDEAMAVLQWDSNRTALWELDYRLTHDLTKLGTS
jgi:dATP pyrophosphohydrolase